MSRHLRALDLNLVPVLRALLIERNVTRAARRIGLSQPAASNALSRLRAMLEDPLLIKHGRRMILSPYADQLLPMVHSVCLDLERLLQAETWSPAQVSRAFVVVMGEFFIRHITPSLCARLAAEAPNVTIRFDAVGPRLRESLHRGAVDLLYLSYADVIAQDMDIQRIARMPLWAVARPDHPFVTAPPRTMEAFLDAPRVGIHLIASLLGEGQAAMAQLLRPAHLAVEFNTNQLAALPAIAQAMGCLAVVPQPIAEDAIATRDMRAIAIPGRPVHYELCQYAPPQFRSDPAHIWLRTLLTGLLETVIAPEHLITNRPPAEQLSRDL